MADALRDGALALAQLHMDVRMQVERDDLTNNVDLGIDVADYAAIDAMVLRSIAANMFHGDPAHRQGYVRALTWLFHCMALDLVPNTDDRMVCDVLSTMQTTAGGPHD